MQPYQAVEQPCSSRPFRSSVCLTDASVDESLVPAGKRRGDDAGRIRITGEPCDHIERPLNLRVGWQAEDREEQALAAVLVVVQRPGDKGFGEPVRSEGVPPVRSVIEPAQPPIGALPRSGR